MDFTLFFAWQFDSPPNDNRYLIRDAAKDAVKRVAADADVEESPRLDHDTKGLSGTPEVANALHSLLDGNAKKVLISVALWLPYLLLSARVNVTFRHRVAA